jgi:magnesium chelatase subunit H
LVGARPVKEGTGRTVNFELVPLNELGRPRIDVLASLSGIFRDSFANVVDLLDDMFERAATADESPDMNYIKKHALELEADGTERPAARLFSNPPGDYGSMGKHCTFQIHLIYSVLLATLSSFPHFSK